MVVEVLGFFIVVGVMLAVIVRRHMAEKGVQAQKNLDDSASQLQIRMEEVADTVIKRLENRIDHLEMLIADADEKIGRMDDQIKTMTLLHQSAEQFSAAERERRQRPSQGAAEPFFAGPSAALPRPARVSPRREPAAAESAKPAPRRRPTVQMSKMNRKVMELLESGHTLDEVAKQTGIGKGAILLIKAMGKS